MITEKCSVCGDLVKDGDGDVDDYGERLCEKCWIEYSSVMAGAWRSGVHGVAVATNSNGDRVFVSPRVGRDNA